MKEEHFAGVQARRAVYVSFAVAIMETVGLAVAAVITHASAIGSQAAASVADLAVQGLLFVGVVTSSRLPDKTHPLGYGRDRFFWSLLAAVGVFAGGFVVAFDDALRGFISPSEVGAFGVGYAVLGVSILLDAVALVAALRPVRAQARARGLATIRWLRRSTDPATTTEAVGNTIGVVGGGLALLALAITQLTGNGYANACASALIGVMLIAAAVVLVQTNRGLLTGRGVSGRMLEAMGRLVAAEPGVIEVADLFAVVIGPATLIVDGDLVFDDVLGVREVEVAISRIGAALQARWPAIAYVYLTPVAARRRRGRHDATAVAMLSPNRPARSPG